MGNPFEKFMGPKLQSTAPEAFQALEEKVHEIAATVGTDADNIKDRDIHQAALHAALMRERAGKPYTIGDVDAMSEDDKLAIAEALGLRLQDRPQASVLVQDQQGVVKSASSMSEARDTTATERERQEGPSV